jgi:predicted lipoprotein with Yx(FWY)xxD motif
MLALRYATLRRPRRSVRSTPTLRPTRKDVSVNNHKVLLITAALALTVAGCGSSSTSSTGSTAATAPPTPTSTTNAASAGRVKISSATIPRLGPTLVDAKGRTLYAFVPDKDQKVTCVGGCTAIWPPAFLPNRHKPIATAPVKQSLLASDPDPAGGRVITYAGWPLYTYVTDRAPGQATGQALNLNGGLWYAISPAGKLITKKP